MTNQAIPHELIYHRPLTPNLRGIENPSLITSLRRQLRDLLFPEKHKPLRLTSRPVAVRSIWERRDYKRSTTYSLIVHALLITAIVAATMIKPAVTIQQPKEHVVLITPSDILLPLAPKVDKAMHGGGGGGSVAKLEAPKGRLPKQSMLQITPPVVEIKNENPKLPVEPTVAVPENIKLANNTMPTLGDPVARVAGPASNGIGSGGGIGAGKGTGIGIGTGAGVGPGSGGGYGGGVFQVGGGVQAPVPLYHPEPEFTEEARQAKYQGTVILGLIIGADGRPRNVHVKRPLGMGLDQKAIEAVRSWKFQPAMKEGHPVTVAFQVEVEFTLH